MFSLSLAKAVPFACAISARNEAPNVCLPISGRKVGFAETTRAKAVPFRYEAIDTINTGHDDRACPLQRGESPRHLQAQMLGPDFSPHPADPHIVEGLSIGIAHPSDDIARNGEVG